MKIFVGQIYIEPGVEFPFTQHFQLYVGEELSRIADDSPDFTEQYGDDYKLIFRLSAKSGILAAELKGPTVFRRQKDVEFTVFVPCGKLIRHDLNDLERALRQFFGCVAIVFEKFQLGAQKLQCETDRLVQEILTTRKMLSAT